jgi:hypothetical protein
MVDAVLVVRLRADVAPLPPYRAGAALDAALASLLGPRLAAFRAAFPRATFGPRYTAVSPQRLQALEARTRGRAPGSPDKGLRRTYELRVPDATDVHAIAEGVRAWNDVVERVTRSPPRTLLPTVLNPAGDAAAYKLHYQGPARILVPDGVSGPLHGYDWGIDVEYAWGIDGGRGEGGAVVDVEQGWHLDHDDLAAVAVGTCVPPPAFVNGDPNDTPAVEEQSKVHGTCVLGILVGATTGTGVTGSAHQTGSVAVAGEFTRRADGTIVAMPEPHNAIVAATSWLDGILPGGGGVLLLETSENWGWYDAGEGTAGAPIELREEVHDLLLVVADLGHVVVAAAGNGGLDLDALDYALATTVPSDPLDPPDPPVDLSNPAVNDSKAILVAASNPPIDKDGATWVYMDGVAGVHRRRPTSCHGARVDCHGWGDYVASCSSPPATHAQFSGTSSAAAVVAGAVLVLQGIWKAHGPGGPLTPHQVRELLRDPALGTPVWDPETYATKVGHVPDLFRILTQSALFKPLDLVPDVYVRDTTGDDGTVPSVGPCCESPDIIVRQSSEPDPGKTWGQGSRTEQRLDLCEPVLAMHHHHVYVRARNRGKADARNAIAKVYWSEVATLVTPAMWHEIGAGGAVFDGIPRTGELVVSRELFWPADATLTKADYCFVAVLGADGDPAPVPAAMTDFADFIALVRDGNQVAWRNFKVIDAQLSALSLPPEEFWVPGAFDLDREFELRVVVDRPKVSRAALELPGELYERLGAPASADAGVNPSTGAVRIGVAALERLDEGVYRLGRAVLPRYDPRRSDEAPATVRVHLSPASLLRPRSLTVSVVQLHEGVEVGRVGWRVRQRRRT